MMNKAHFPARRPPDLKTSKNSKHSPVTAIREYVTTNIIYIPNCLNVHEQGGVFRVSYTQLNNAE